MNLIKTFSQQIRTNIISTSEGKFVQAGNHQFQSFWTRDFCWASFGLVAIREYEVVKNHLQFLLNQMNQDGLIPRILESGRSDKTVVLNTLFRFLPRRLIQSQHHKKLKAEHFGEHGTLSIDSNALVILALIHYVEASGDTRFLEDNKDKLRRCFLFYKTRMREGLVWQDKFEDWQDSAERLGKTFYTNLLYYQAVQKLSDYKIIQSDLDALKKHIISTFYRKGIFQSHNQYNRVSLEANYLAIIWDFLTVQEATELYHACNKPLYQRQDFPLCSWPCYNKKDISWTTKIVGLSHYHDEMLWSWILGLKLKAAKKLNLIEEVSKCEKLLEKLVQQNDFLFEIYHPQTLRPYKNIFYCSEYPFSWGLGINLWALS